MNPGDRRERDSILKMLRRRPISERPIKKTTPELMQELTESFQGDYADGVDDRKRQTRTFFDNDRKAG